MKNLFLSLFLIFCTLLSNAQTSYTWNGSVDTDFATASNWTPSGVPTSADDITISNVTNDPVLDGNRTVNQLTLNSGGLFDFGGYTLTVTTSSTLGAGALDNGKLTMTSGSASVNGTDVGCTLELKASFSNFKNSIFRKNTTIEFTGSGLGTGSNVFKDTTTITQLTTAILSLGQIGADTFLAPLTFNLDVAGTTSFIHGGTGHYYADDVYINNRSGNTLRHITIGKWSGSAHFAGDIILHSDSLSGDIDFKSVISTHDGDLIISEDGYDSGRLYLSGYRVGASSQVVDLDGMGHNAKVHLGPNLVMDGEINGPQVGTLLEAGCTFNNRVNLSSVTSMEWYTGSEFNDVTNLTITKWAMNTGSNVFRDSANITYAGGNYFEMGKFVPDSFLAPATFTIASGGGSFTLARSTAGNYFADNVTLNNNSGSTSKRFNITNNSAGRAIFDGDIIMNVDSTSGSIYMKSGQITHNGNLVIGEDGYHSGGLWFQNYTQTVSTTMDLGGMNHGSWLRFYSGTDITADVVFESTRNAALLSATFRGDVAFKMPSASITNCDFYGTTSIEKTGSTNNTNGGNTFRGATTIENSSTSNYLYWGHNNADAFLDDLTLINRSSKLMWMNYTTTGHYGGDITLDGDNARVIRFGSNVAGRVAVFDGAYDQRLSILEEDLNVQAYRLKVDKSGGRLKVYNDVSVAYELSLTDGIIESKNDAVITLADGVEPIGSNDSYIEGSVQKIGNDAFTFPVGRNGVYRPIGISAPSSATDAFTAEYFESNSDWINSHDEKDVSLDHLSTNEYWTLTRDAGTSTPTVTLSWDTLTSCTMEATLTARHVAGWDGSNWDDLGNGGTTGTADVGTVVSSAGVSDFEMFVLESDSSLGCAECNVATRLLEIDTVVSGTLNPNTELWFSFETEIDSGYVVSLTTNDTSLTLVPKLSLFESTCARLEAAKTTENDPIFVIESESVTYTVLLENIGSDTLNYDLALSRIFSGAPCENFINNNGFENGSSGVNTCSDEWLVEGTWMTNTTQGADWYHPNAPITGNLGVVTCVLPTTEPSPNSGVAHAGFGINMNGVSEWVWAPFSFSGNPPLTYYKVKFWLDRTDGTGNLDIGVGLLDFENLGTFDQINNILNNSSALQVITSVGQTNGYEEFEFCLPYDGHWLTALVIGLANAPAGTHYFHIDDVSMEETICIQGNTNSFCVGSGGISPGLIAVGGSSYEWELNGTVVSTDANYDISGLPVGEYTLELTGTTPGGCVVTESVDFEVFDIATVSINGNENYCPDAGVAVLSATPYNTTSTYLWSNAETTESVSVSDGSYYVSVVDENGCEATSETVVVLESPIPTITGTVTNTSCSAESDGSVVVSAPLWTEDLGWSWNYSHVTGTNPNNLGPATYIVTATTDNGCEVQETFVITAGTGPCCTGDVYQSIDYTSEEGEVMTGHPQW